MQTGCGMAGDLGPCPDHLQTTFHDLARSVWYKSYPKRRSGSDFAVVLALVRREAVLPASMLLR